MQPSLCHNADALNILTTARSETGQCQKKEREGIDFSIDNETQYTLGCAVVMIRHNLSHY